MTAEIREQIICRASLALWFVEPQRHAARGGADEVVKLRTCLCAALPHKCPMPMTNVLDRPYNYARDIACIAVLLINYCTAANLHDIYPAALALSKRLAFARAAKRQHESWCIMSV
jgi:hypothetical protein